MCETEPTSWFSCKIDNLCIFPSFYDTGPNVSGIIVIINGHYNVIVIYSAEGCNLSLSKQGCNIDTRDFEKN